MEPQGSTDDVEAELTGVNEKEQTLERDASSQQGLCANPREQ